MSLSKPLSNPVSEPRSISRFADLPTLFAAITASPDFIRAFGDPIPLTIVESGEQAGEHDMPEPLAVQAECGAVIAAIFDLFTGTRLEPLAPDIAWGFVNSFHFVANKLERREERFTDEIRRMMREPDLSEVYNSELEEKQLRVQSTTEQREAIEVMRDYAAGMYRAQSGWAWSPAKGSKASPVNTATQVAVQDYLRARGLAERERYVPQGPIVVASGHAVWHDWQPIWDRLDAIHARIPHMMLVTTAQRRGFDAIVASWAGARGVPMVAYTLPGGGRSAPYKRNRKMVELRPVEAVLGEGSGIQDNLYQLMRKADVPIHAFRKADQAPAQSVGRPGAQHRRRAA